MCSLFSCFSGAKGIELAVFVTEKQTVYVSPNDKLVNIHGVLKTSV